MTSLLRLARAGLKGGLSDLPDTESRGESGDGGADGLTDSAERDSGLK